MSWGKLRFARGLVVLAGLVSGWAIVPLGAGSVSPAGASPGGAPYEMAYQSNILNLNLEGDAGFSETLQGMMDGTNPSVTALTDGGYQVAFQSNTGELVTYGTSGIIHTGLGMMSGTSPDITATPGGGYDVAFQTNTGQLWTYTSAGVAYNSNYGMMGGTSPSITTLANGTTQAAFHSNVGSLMIYGSAGYVDTHLGMMAGTSPSIAGSPRGDYEVALQSNIGELWIWSSVTGANNIGQGMRGGTSPANAALVTGGFQTAFQANTTDLVTVGAAEWVNTHQGMADGTSPAIAASVKGGFEIAFQTNVTTLSRYAIGGATYPTNQGMQPHTSPAIAGLIPPPPPPSPEVPGCGSVTSPVGVEATVVARGFRVHACLESAVTALIDAAAADGVNLTGWGWRSTESQIELRKQHCGTSHYAIWEMPSSQCSPPTARPGSSQHERGLAIDFQNCSGSSACFRWLRAHAKDYGLFNLPSESWHWSTTGN